MISTPVKSPSTSLRANVFATRLLLEWTGKGEGYRAGLRPRRGVAQMNLEHGSGEHRIEHISRQERRPRSQAHPHRRIGLELQVRDGVMAPVVRSSSAVRTPSKRRSLGTGVKRSLTFSYFPPRHKVHGGRRSRAGGRPSRRGPADDKGPKSAHPRSSRGLANFIGPRRGTWVLKIVA